MWTEGRKEEDDGRGGGGEGIFSDLCLIVQNKFLFINLQKRAHFWHWKIQLYSVIQLIFACKKITDNYLASD